MKNIILNLLISLPLLASAQSKLAGRIKDKEGHPLDAVTITLKQGDKDIGSVFADLGKFSLNFPAAGNYTIAAGLVGFKPLHMDIQLPKDSLVLVMEPDSRQLHEVTVSIRKPLIERKIDRVTFNVQNSIVASGGSAWEALTKAPGIQVGSANDLSANRKNAQVYMDGKLLKLSGDDLAAYLQGLPSDLVAQIEVFSNPPANFEAEGASVINIITKKAGNEGFNATVNSSLKQGLHTGYNSNGTFNYRKDKLNVYGSYGFTRRTSFQDHDTDIEYDDALWYNPSRIFSRSNNHNYRLGTDYQISSNQVLGILFTGNNRRGSSNGQSITTINNKSMRLDSTLLTDNYTANSGNEYTYNVNYNLKLDSGKKSFNIDLDYSPYQSASNGLVDNASFLPDGTRTTNQFNISTPASQKIDIYSAKADYNQQLPGKWALSSGIKFSSTKSRNNFEYYNRSGSAMTEVPANFNRFTYAEKTGAAYTSINGDLGKWTFQGGLRAEYTSNRGYSVTLDSVNTRSYFKLFPTAFIQYKPNEISQFQVNYAYRIERPEYNRLNPAKRYISPFNIYVGNPALQPAFVHSLELGYTYKQQYNITAYFHATKDLFSNINVQDNVNKIYYGTHANLGFSRSAGIRISVPVHPANWWDMNLLLDGFRQQEKSAYLAGSYNFNIYSYQAFLNQSFTLDKRSGLKAEISGNFTGPGIQGIYHVDHFSEIDAGIKANILKGNGTLKLAFNDIFNRNKFYIRIDYLDQHSGFLHQVESRNAVLSFSYRFGKNVTAARSRSTAGEEERNRAQ